MITPKYFKYGSVFKMHLIGTAMSTKDFYEQIRKLRVAQDPKAKISLIDKEEFLELKYRGITVI